MRNNFIKRLISKARYLIAQANINDIVYGLKEEHLWKNSYDCAYVQYICHSFLLPFRIRFVQVKSTEQEM